MLLGSLASFAAEPFSGKKFDDALEQRVGRAWGGDGESIRQALQQLTESNHVSIVLDRRIDPTQAVSLTVPATPLRDVIATLAKTVDAGTVVVGNVVYVGPAESAKKLRTLIELRNHDLSKLATATLKKAEKSAWKNLTVSLAQRRTIAWKDFDRPRDILKQQIAEKWKLEIDGLDKLPHDLWAGSSLTQVTATEALSLLLIQFGATFEFVPDRAAVRIVPIPDRVVIERSYPSSNTNEVKALVRERFTDAEVLVGGANLIVQATVEQHAEIAAFLKPGGQKVVNPPAIKPDKPLAKRLFTLKLENAALGDVIKTFIGNGVQIKYDPLQFADAEISLEKKINIDVKQKSAEKLFRDLFEPLGIEVTIDGEVVQLRPK